MCQPFLSLLLLRNQSQDCWSCLPQTLSAPQSDHAHTWCDPPVHGVDGMLRLMLSFQQGFTFYIFVVLSRESLLPQYLALTDILHIQNN